MCYDHVTREQDSLIKQSLQVQMERRELICINIKSLLYIVIALINLILTWSITQRNSTEINLMTLVQLMMNSFNDFNHNFCS